MSNKTEIAEILQGHVIQLIMWSQHGGPHLAELFILFFDMKVNNFLWMCVRFISRYEYIAKITDIESLVHSS